MIEKLENTANIFQLDINSEYNIDKESLFGFMGYKSVNYPEILDNYFDLFIKDLATFYKPQAGFFICEKVKVTDKGFYCNDIFFESESIIADKLLKSESMVLFLVTLGKEFDLWSKKEFKEDNPVFGYLIDCAGSILAEKLADLIELHLEKMFKIENKYLTNRYSPGYCGWKTSEQKKLFSFFPDNFCGISLTGTCLMNPIKSISGVIGIGKNVSKQSYQCTICERIDCFRKKII
jgi:hypothetical protein